MAWLLKHEAQIMARPTRAELERATEKSIQPLEKQLDEIKRLLQSNTEQTQLHRSLVGDSLAEIRTSVAVLKERVRDEEERPETHRRMG